MQALLAAWKIPVSGIVPELVQMARHEHDQIREWTAYCLMRIAGSACIGPDSHSRAVRSLRRGSAADSLTLRHLAHLTSPQVRMQAARGLRWNVMGTKPPTCPDPARKTTTGASAWKRSGAWERRSPRVWAVPAACRCAPPLFARIDDDNPNVGITAIEALTHAQGARPGDPLLVDAGCAGFSPTTRRGFGSFACARESVARRGDGDPERARLQAQLDTVLTDRHWTVRAAALDALDLLSQDDRAHLLDRLREDDGRVAKLALSPYFRMRADDATGPILDRLQPELDRVLDSSDAILRYSAWDAVRELYDPGEDAAPIAEEDWTRLEALLAREHAKLAEDPAFVEVRQEMIVAAPQLTRPALGARS
ncbi:MAG: hypothetical protein R3E12_16445 [Candidatus Eisenbacteria bacterium]